MSPISGLTDPTGAVYVLKRNTNSRAYLMSPSTNAERPDTDFFYDAGIYDAYPSMREGYEARRAKERRKVSQVQDWATRALNALDMGHPVPPNKREALEIVLKAIYDVGTYGMTRAEICRTFNRDGGKISGAMTDLHSAGIIFPLDGVRR
jgi:hypothetical protein